MANLTFLFAGPVDIKAEDGGQALIAEIPGEPHGPMGMFVRLQSWSEEKQHPAMEALRGQDVHVIVRTKEGFDYREMMALCLRHLDQKEAMEVMYDCYENASEELRNLVSPNEDLELDARSLVSKSEGGIWVSAWAYVPNDAIAGDKAATYQCEECQMEAPGCLCDQAGLRFADPTGHSALRAASASNPRNLPCPSCHQPNRLTPADRAQGYQCDSCADRAESGW